MTIAFRSAVELARTKINKSYNYLHLTDVRSLDLLFEACQCLLTIEHELAKSGLADKEFEIPEMFSKDFQKPLLEVF